MGRSAIKSNDILVMACVNACVRAYMVLLLLLGILSDVNKHF